MDGGNRLRWIGFAFGGPRRWRSRVATPCHCGDCHRCDRRRRRRGCGPPACGPPAPAPATAPPPEVGVVTSSRATCRSPSNFPAAWSVIAMSRSAPRSAASCSSANSRKAPCQRGPGPVPHRPGDLPGRAGPRRGAARPGASDPEPGGGELQAHRGTGSAAQVATAKQREEALAPRDQARAAVQLARGRGRERHAEPGYTDGHARRWRGHRAAVAPDGTLIQAQQTLLTTITPARSGLCELLLHRRRGTGRSGRSTKRRAQADLSERTSRSSCSSATAPPIRRPARSTRRPGGSTRRPARSRRARSSPTRTAACCRASSCA